MDDILEKIGLVPDDAGPTAGYRIHYRGRATRFVISRPLPTQAATIVRSEMLRRDLRDAALSVQAMNPSAWFRLSIAEHFSQFAASRIAAIVVLADDRETEKKLQAEVMAALSALGWRIAPAPGDPHILDAPTYAQTRLDCSAHTLIRAVDRVRSLMALTREGARYPRRLAPFHRLTRAPCSLLIDEEDRLSSWNETQQRWDCCLPPDASDPSWVPAAQACGAGELIYRYTDNLEPHDRTRDLFEGEVLSDVEKKVVGFARFLDLDRKDLHIPAREHNEEKEGSDESKVRIAPEGQTGPGTPRDLLDEFHAVLDEERQERASR